MGQNTSPAVMAQRQEAHDSLDDFPTPPWAVRSFCRWLQPDPAWKVWEPAANRGYMAGALAEFFDQVEGSDVHDYGAGFPLYDFLMFGEPLHRPDWIITNPPFRLAEEFVDRALGIASDGVAIIVRSVWSEGSGRFERIFRDRPPAWILQHVHRVPMVRGRYDPEASTATSYSWFVWRQEGERQTRFGWLPEGRSDLYVPGDEIISH